MRKGLRLGLVVLLFMIFRTGQLPHETPELRLQAKFLFYFSYVWLALPSPLKKSIKDRWKCILEDVSSTILGQLQRKSCL